MCRKAAQLYKEAGRSSAAAEALSKAAKLVEDKNPKVGSMTFQHYWHADKTLPSSFMHNAIITESPQDHHCLA